MADEFQDEGVFNRRSHFSCHRSLPKYQCVKCPTFQTNCWARLKVHIATGHPNTSSTENVIKCANCPFVTHSKLIILYHIVMKKCPRTQIYERRDRLDLNFTIREEPERLRYSDIEDAMGSRSEESSSHVGTESDSKLEGIRMYKCKYCPTTCRVRTGLKEHVEHCHQGVEAVACDQCSLKFKQKMSLLRHKTEFHLTPEVRWWRCQFCPYKTTVERHWRIHSNEHCLIRRKKPNFSQMFRCKYCAYVDQKKINVERHILFCHKKRKGNNCGYCSMKFKEASTLNRHVKTFHPDAENIDPRGIALRHARVEETCDESSGTSN